MGEEGVAVHPVAGLELRFQGENVIIPLLLGKQAIEIPDGVEVLFRTALVPGLDKQRFKQMVAIRERLLPRLPKDDAAGPVPQGGCSAPHRPWAGGGQHLPV